MNNKMKQKFITLITISVVVFVFASIIPTFASEESEQYASNNYILPVADSLVYNNKLYARFDKSIANFQNIYSSCFQLAELTNNDVYNVYKSLIRNGTKNYYIVGANKNGNNWVNQYTGTVIDNNVFPWKENEPSGDGTQITLRASDGLLNDGSLSETSYGFIACMDLGIAPYASSYYNTNRYVVYRNTIPASMARLYCKAKGGYLATITSSEEDTAIKNLTDVDILIGGIRTGSGTTDFEWETGEAFSYSNWASGEPNNSTNYGGQPYINQYQNGTWDDDCDKSTGGAKCNEGFVCEYEPKSLTIEITQNETHEITDDEIHIIATYPDNSTNDISSICRR